jgi:hypothetical protein
VTSGGSTVLDTLDIAAGGSLLVAIPNGWDLPDGFVLTGSSANVAGAVAYTIEA